MVFGQEHCGDRSMFFFSHHGGKETKGRGQGK